MIFFGNPVSPNPKFEVYICEVTNTIFVDECLMLRFLTGVFYWKKFQTESGERRHQGKRCPILIGAGLKS